MDRRPRLNFLFVSFVLCCSSWEAKGTSTSDGKIFVDKVEDYFHERERRDVEQNKTINNDTIYQDDHKYYTAHYLTNGEDMWNELDGHEQSITHWDLTNGTTKYSGFQLKFKFPFYGHPVENISISSEGFIYLGWVSTRFDIMQQVMYIAPLMAYFNVSASGSSAVYYLSNTNQFTVQWTNVSLALEEEAGPFTFQCTLFKDGKIHFAYKSIPKNVSDINGTGVHAVRVGLSDAFTVVQYSFYQEVIIRTRIFYRYHTVRLNKSLVQSGSAIILSKKPNCISASSCDECRGISQTTEFSCRWCNRLQRCSDSVDRHRVEWFYYSCNRFSVITEKECAAPVSPTATSIPTTVPVVVATGGGSSGMGAGAIIGICLTIAIIIGIGAWCLFAYMHPNSSSGLFLISLRYKPRELFRRGGADASSGGGAAVQGTTRSSTLA